MAKNIYETFHASVSAVIEDILFKQDNLTSVEKVKLSLVSKDKLGIYTNKTRARINRIYDEVKNTHRISIDDANFIEKQIVLITEEEMDYYEGEDDEDSAEYKDFCYRLTVDFAYNKLYTVYLALEIGNKVKEGENYVLADDHEDYQANATEIHAKLERHNIVCEFPDIQNLEGYMTFVNNLGLKQKICVGL